ncbi:hypothetical protein Ddye_002077 [Dipteronia dyeriana]|uniref:MULE transposase domain-containing protein n=1 Tax=Dipteronia dyeriana TaxID=168575 RepID=A0AAD9XR34_9ROSI|nr:hypothetical protein Ddye_002077 [Dipteronia dyeriana]
MFTYGFMALGACVKGFNTVSRSVIAIYTTHLKAKTIGVLLVDVCKDGNEMIYPLAFGFTNSECTESWTWFLKRHREVIMYLEHVMIVLDRHVVHDRRRNALEMHTCLTHDANQHNKQRIFSLQWLKGMPINILCFDFFTTGWLKYAYVMNVNPVPKPKTWDIPDAVHDRIVLPWEKKTARKTKEVKDTLC